MNHTGFCPGTLSSIQLHIDPDGQEDVAQEEHKATPTGMDTENEEYCNSSRSREAKSSNEFVHPANVTLYRNSKKSFASQHKPLTGNIESILMEEILFRKEDNQLWINKSNGVTLKTRARKNKFLSSLDNETSSSTAEMRNRSSKNISDETDSPSDVILDHEEPTCLNEA